jgi:ribonuclease P/MRP protein subunit POP1
VTLEDLKDCLGRFRLTGPLSHAVISKALRSASMENRDQGWTTDYYPGDSTRNESLMLQTKAWERLGRAVVSPAQIPPRSVLPLTVVDPRFTMPAKRTKALPDTEGNLK